MATSSAVDKRTKKDLAILVGAGVLDNFYLAGGTGLAFLLEHRRSYDLDFFTRDPFSEQHLIESIRALGYHFDIEKKTPETVRGIFRSTLVSFFHYPYRLLANPKKISGVPIASLTDIACMKLDAIASRGTKRDFIDLYTIMTTRRLSLAKLSKLFSKKYAPLHTNWLHIQKSLVYFEDAEHDPMPRMLKLVAWRSVKKYFFEEIRKLS